MRLQKIFVPVLAGLLCFGYSTGAIAQETMLHTITVTGQGDEAIATSISQVRLGVEVKGTTAEQVQADIAKRSNQVVNFLKGKKVEKLTTTGINLQPEYDYSQNGDRRLLGYVATNTVSFDVSITQAGSIIDEAVKAGATRIDGISFRATDAALADAQNIALAEAAKNAQTQAKVVLTALGLSPKEIVQIQVNGASTPTPIYRTMDSLKVMAAAAPSPVEGGEQTVNASVTLTIQY